MSTKITTEQAPKIDSLVRQCIVLGGKGGVVEDYGYGPSICPSCHQPVRAEGQQVLNAMATAEGIYFRCKVPCGCGCSLGFVAIEKDSERSEEET